MIRKLEHQKTRVAEEIREVFQASYAVEARLLKATDFPPLKRQVPDFKKSNNDFYGYFKDGTLAGAVEVIPGKASSHIQSLVVHPKFFQQGIGSALLTFLLNSFECPLFTVETGLDNGPATALYRKFGFQEVGQYDTDHGVRKVQFEKRVGPDPQK
jgi:ribosomal protein S18 acetylase RimI-like enzyme